jgi:ubiquinone/menaquinone biosynthesis C-methylase UbiE
MDRQKTTQQRWYDHTTPLQEDEIINISTRTHIKRLKEVFPVQKAKFSLNCGCGRGGQEDIFGASIGIDISFENIRSLIQRGGQGVVADMEYLPFKEQTFDLVYGFGILHHLSDIKRGVSEATRVLKNGGCIGFGGENNGLCPLVYVMSFVYRNWRIEKGSYRIREANLRKIFRESGIRDFEISRHGMAIYGLGKTIYQMTSLMEMIFLKIEPLKLFSGYCYMSGRKPND